MPDDVLIISNEARQAFRDLLMSARFKPLAPEFAQLADTCERMLPAFVTTLSDREIDSLIGRVQEHLLHSLLVGVD